MNNATSRIGKSKVDLNITMTIELANSNNYFDCRDEQNINILKLECVDVFFHNFSRFVIAI